MASSTDMRATGETLQIPELLVSIIGHLPYEDIKNARMVLKRWKYAIDDTLTLRQQLFVDTNTQPGTRGIYIWTGGPKCSLHGEPSGHFHPPSKEHPSKGLRASDSVAREVIAAHPLFEVSKRGRWYSRLGMHMTLPWTLAEMLKWSEGGKRERQLLTQPPRSLVTIFVADGQDEVMDDRSRMGFELEVEVPTGVGLGDVVAALKDEVNETNEKREERTADAKVDLERFKEVCVTINEKVVPANSHWVREAEEHEKALEDRRVASGAFKRKRDDNSSENRWKNSAPSKCARILGAETE